MEIKINAIFRKDKIYKNDTAHRYTFGLPLIVKFVTSARVSLLLPTNWDLAQQRVKTSLLNHKEIQCLTHSASSLRTSTHLPAESGRTSFSVEYDHGAQREMVRGMIPPVRVGQQAAGQYPHAAAYEQIVDRRAVPELLGNLNGESGIAERRSVRRRLRRLAGIAQYGLHHGDRFALGMSVEIAVQSTGYLSPATARIRRQAIRPTGASPRGRRDRNGY